MVVIIDNPVQIALFTMKAQLSACKLELLGMKHSSGRSIIAHIKKVHDLHGTKAKVVEQFTKLVHITEDNLRQTAQGSDRN